MIRVRVGFEVFLIKECESKCSLIKFKNNLIKGWIWEILICVGIWVNMWSWMISLKIRAIFHECF